MELSFQNQTTTEKHNENLFELKMDNVKNLSVILKVLNFKEVATCFVSTNGLKVVVEDPKCVQVSAYVCSDVFQDLFLKDNQQVAFRLDLSTLLECLTIFDHCSSIPGMTSALMMSYKYNGASLKIILEENGIITDCLLKTMDADDILDFHFPTTSDINKVIVQSTEFKEIFNDLDSSSDCVEFFLSPEPPHFVITTFGLCGECQVNISQSCDMIELFDCKLETKSRYKYAHIKPAIKPLAVSNKVAIRTSSEGLLCLQFMIHTEDKQICYVEYYCVPVVDDDDDDDKDR